MRKLLEHCTVAAGLIFLVTKTWAASPVWTAGQCFIGVTAGNFVTPLLLEWKFGLKDLQLYRCVDAGLWCCSILPAVVSVLRPDDWAWFHFTVPCSLVVYLRGVDQSVTAKGIAVTGLVAYITALLVWLLNPLNVVMLVYLGVYCGLLWQLPRWYPRSFTFGEVAMVTQLFTYFLHMSLSPFFHKNVWKRRILIDKSESVVMPLDKLTGILFLGIVLVSVLITKSSQWCHRPIAGLIASILAVAGAFCLPAAICTVGWQDLWTVIVQLFWSKTSILLFLWWLICSAASIALVTSYGSRPTGDCHVGQAGSQYDLAGSGGGDAQTLSESKQAKDVAGSKPHKSMKQHDGTTEGYKVERVKKSKDGRHQAGDELKGLASEPHNWNQWAGETCKAGTQQTGGRVPSYVRKYFHVAMLCVYVPGVLYKPELLYLASAIAAGGLIVIEVIRAANIPVFSDNLNQYLCVFLDQQDQGDLILTPVYLLIGCSMPLWLEPRRSGASPLSVYAGLISVGVGDSLASLIGRRWGKHKWPDSQKSVEGTVAAVIGQILAVLLLAHCGVPDSGLTVAVVTVVCLSVCLEAFSSQIDNLVVPVFTFMLLAANSRPLDLS